MRYLRSCFFTILLVVVTSITIEAAGIPVGTSITNQASISYSSGEGVHYSAVSNSVATSVLQSYGVAMIAEKNSADVQTGSETLLVISLTNTGNGPDSFSLSAATGKLWPLSVYADVNGDGILQDGERVPLLKTDILAADAVQKLFIVVTVAEDAVDGDSDTLNMVAKSVGDVNKTASVAILLNLRRASMTLDKRVDKADATMGETLTYTITYTNKGSLAADEVVLTDTIPLNSSYIPGSLKLNGVAHQVQPDAVGKLVIRIGSVAAGGTGTVAFQVQVK